MAVVAFMVGIGLVVLLIYGIYRIGDSTFLGSDNIDIEWQTHIMMTKKRKKYADGTFADFLKMYESVKDWEFDKNYPTSLFSKSDRANTRIHASMIKFQGVCMLLDEKSYGQFLKWEKESEQRHKEYFNPKEAFKVPWRKEVSGV